MKQRDIIKGFDAFSIRITTRMSEVRDCLVAQRYEEAQQLLADIARTHASTSLSLRNVLVKSGRLNDR